MEFNSLQWLLKCAHPERRHAFKVSPDSILTVSFLVQPPDGTTRAVCIILLRPFGIVVFPNSYMYMIVHKQVLVIFFCVGCNGIAESFLHAVILLILLGSYSLYIHMIIQ